MKVILIENIKKLGKIGDLVTVKDGFARNYLFPEKKALRENKKNLEHFEKLKEEIAIKEKVAIENAKKTLKKLEDIKIIFEKEADEKDKLYGSVSATEIKSFLKDIDIKEFELKYINKVTFYFGTDKYGRDMLSRMIIGCRVSISIGFEPIKISFTH